MDRMIDDLLDGGLWKAGKLRLCLEPVDLVAWLPSLLDRFGTAREVERIVLELPSGSAWVLADGLRLERVVLNLVANALKYSPEDGRVCVSISSAEGLATLTVSDLGPGIPEEDRPRLFERFHRGRGAANRPGVGLGLFSARLLVLAHGGRLRVSSAPGRGATFLVDLPAAEEPDPSILAPRDRPDPLR
jgi:signal transduction histidine kinase